MGVQVTTIRPGFVAEIIGLDISRPVPPDDMAALWDASDEHAVLVFRGKSPETAEAFAGGCPQHDDMTVWLGRVEESGCRTLTPTDSVALQAVA